MKRLLIIGLILMMSLGLVAERKALIIGNSTYDGMTLASPLNDSEDMRNALGGWGFTVTKAENLNLRRMTAVIDSFAKGISSNDEVFFYYSGHGTRENGVNYLVPSGINMRTAQSYAQTSFSVKKLINSLNKAKATIIMLEASRNWLPITATSPKFFENQAVHDSTLSVIMSAQPFRTVTETNPERSAFTQAFIRKFSQSEAGYNATIVALSQELRAVPRRPVDPWISERPLKNDLLLNNVKQKYKFKTDVQDLEGGGSISW